MSLRPSKIRVIILVLSVLSTVAIMAAKEQHDTNPVLGISIPKQQYSSLQCQQSLSKGCEETLRKLFTTHRAVLLRPCCKSVLGLSDYCFRDIFSSDFTIGFGNTVKKVCIQIIGFVPPSPPKYHRRS